MKTPLFKTHSVSVQLVAFTLMAFCSASIFSFVGLLSIKGLWGIDAISDATVLERYSEEGVIGAKRFFMTCWHLGLFIIPAVLFPKLVSNSRKEYLSFNAPQLKALVLAVVSIVVGFPIINWLIDFNQSIQLPASMADIETWAKTMEASADATTKAFLGQPGMGALFINIFVLAVIPAVGEELVFRGVLQKLFTRYFKHVHAAIWVCGFLFSLMHLEFYGFIPRMLMGVLFGYLMIWSGTIWVPIVAHFTNNVIAILINYFTANNTIDASLDEFGASNATWWVLLSVIILAGVLWLFKRSSKWETMKEAYLSN